MTITNGVYTYAAGAEAIISIKTISGKTVVFKQIMIDEDIQDVVLPVSDEFVLGANGYSTYANKFKYTVSGATVYKAKVNTNKDAVVLTALDANAVIPANTGIILKGTEGETVTIMATDNNATTISENDLLGTTAEIDAPTNAYVISTNVVNEVNVTAFNPCGAELKIPAHKAYLVIEGANPQAAPIRIIMEGQNATNIENLEGAEEAVKFIENGKLFIRKNGVIYDATGAVVR
jgi:predicted  nucleic acid-binding Zn-ribbon protein